jgi:hypothetical protein
MKLFFFCMVSDLNKLAEWCKAVALDSKCIDQFFRTTSSCFLMLRDVILDCINSISDLRVILDSRMSFAEHVDIEVGKALEMQGFVERVSRKFRDSSTFKTFYLSLVLLKLEYVKCL